MKTITTLASNEVFVFDSNESGFHGAGAAGFAFSGTCANDWRTCLKKLARSSQTCVEKGEVNLRVHLAMVAVPSDQWPRPGLGRALLYVTTAVGKPFLIKDLGVPIIKAQCDRAPLPAKDRFGMAGVAIQ